MYRGFTYAIDNRGYILLQQWCALRDSRTNIHTFVVGGCQKLAHISLTKARSGRKWRGQQVLRVVHACTSKWYYDFESTHSTKGTFYLSARP